MWAIDRRDQVRRATRRRRCKHAIEKTILQPWPIEVRQAQDGATDLSRRVGLKQQVFLLFAHPALEGVWLARMIFTHRRGLSTAIRVDRPDEEHLLDSFGNRSIDGLTHHDRMQLKVVVRDTDEVHRRVYTA